MSAFHLVSRFFGSLAASSLSVDEHAWVEANLLPGELELWLRMSKQDQRHTYGVARKAEALLGKKSTRPLMAAALLHDIGKIEANIGTFTRVFATLAGSTASDAQKESWAGESGWLGKAGQYLRHNELGAEMLERVGSDPVTVTWAREHEWVHSRWTLPEDITDALWKADN